MTSSTSVADETATSMEGLQQDLVALMVSPETAKTDRPIIDPLPTPSVTTKVDFDRYAGHPMAKFA